jgi:hypothetical protein
MTVDEIREGYWHRRPGDRNAHEGRGNGQPELMVRYGRNNPSPSFNAEGIRNP